MDGLEPLLARREAREPLAYVLGEWGFRRLTLKTDARALVPRPETETLVERALALVEGIERPRILDVGVGSGAIALALKDERPDAQVTGVDVSADALALARENAERLGLDVELRRGRRCRRRRPRVGTSSSRTRRTSRATDELQPELRWEPEVALLGRRRARATRAGGEGALRRLRGRRRPGAAEWRRCSSGSAAPTSRSPQT